MRNLAMVCLAGVLALVMGCSVRRNVSLTMQAEDFGGSVPPTRVQIVGVQQVELEKYKSYPVDQWFKADDPLRQGSIIKELMFGRSQPDTQTLYKKDPLWRNWIDRECLYLVVFVNLPAGANAGASEDPRKVIIPLKRVDSQVSLRVLRSGIQFAVPPRPED